MADGYTAGWHTTPVEGGARLEVGIWRDSAITDANGDIAQATPVLSLSPRDADLLARHLTDAVGVAKGMEELLPLAVESGADATTFARALTKLRDEKTTKQMLSGLGLGFGGLGGFG